jgi:hypothetical protein
MGTTNRETVANTQTSSATDNRTDNSIGAGATVAGGDITNIDDYIDDDSVTLGDIDFSDRSVTDNSDRSIYLSDASDRSVTDSRDQSFTDYSDRRVTDSRDQSFTDYSDRSVTDNSDRSLVFTDISDRSSTDSRDQSFNDYSDNRVTDNSDRSLQFSDARDQSVTDNSDRSLAFADHSDNSVTDASDRSLRLSSTDARDFRTFDNSVTTITDGGAVEYMSAVAMRGLDAGSDIADLGFAFASDAQSESFDAIQSILRESAQADAMGDAASASVFAKAIDASQSEGSKLVKTIVLAAAGVAALAFMGA